MNEYDMLDRQYAIVENERDHYKGLYEDATEENRELRAKLRAVEHVAETAPIFRPDQDLYGDAAYDDVQCIDLALLRDALNGVGA